ncbi:hypothetical protein TNCV_3585621 [Trichonephila clavipes]|nr:hypothetical protein TNCV_3585621 [Trichonephila clavipes]
MCELLSKAVKQRHWAERVCQSEHLQERRKKEKREKERAQKRRGLVVFGKRRKEDLGVLDRNADQESWTRIRKNALRTVPRQAVGYHTG